MAVDDLSAFAADVGNVDWTAVGGAFGGPSGDPGFGSQALSFAKDVGGGIGKAGNWLTTGSDKGQPTQPSPLSSFSSALGLGATGFGIANQLRTAGLLNQQTQQIAKGQKAAQAAAAPAVSFGQETLAAAEAGKLPGPMQAAVEQWKQQAKADMRARLASMGLGNSTDIQSEDAKIDLMGESMIAQLLQGQEALGLQGLETGVSAATGGAKSAQDQQVLLTNLIQGANQQLAHLGATA